MTEITPKLQTMRMVRFKDCCVIRCCACDAEKKLSNSVRYDAYK